MSAHQRHPTATDLPLRYAKASSACWACECYTRQHTTEAAAAAAKMLQMWATALRWNGKCARYAHITYTYRSHTGLSCVCANAFTSLPACCVCCSHLLCINLLSLRRRRRRLRMEPEASEANPAAYKLGVQHTITYTHTPAGNRARREWKQILT